MPRKSKEEKTRAQIERDLGKARVQLQRLDERLARLRSVKDRLSYLQNQSERNRAIMSESVNEWIAEYQERNPGDGIAFDDLHCDFLMLDEAQNMKNLWTVGRREGGVPKYLGAINEGSDRALGFAIRAFLTAQETGGSGTALLSATPAKNSPLEFFTLLGYVDHYAWTRRATYDPENFIDRYLRLEQRTILKPDGNIESRSAVVGFKNLTEFRDLVFRYSDFKEAAEVGLKLPASKRTSTFLDMNEVQREKYQAYRSVYEKLVTGRAGAKERYEALGVLQKMGLVALHPELDSPPTVGRTAKGKEKKQWTWANAASVRDRHSPKLDECVKTILQRRECGHIVFCDNVPVHRWLFDSLVEAGIPAERIAILNADRAPTPMQRQQIAEDFNGIPAIIDPETGRIEQEAVPPKYDVVICNAVAYEGIDLQVRTCRVIHLDLPYEPATLEQRNGRAVRQGNMQSVVEIIYLLSNKSYDAIKFGMITGKLRWMGDIIKGADRETNNPAAGMDLSTEDLLLMLADDPVAARAALEAVKRQHEKEARQQAEERAWSRLSDLVSYLRMAASYDEELQREQARKQAMKTVEYLRAVPSDIWPWQGLVDKALTGLPMTIVGVFYRNSANEHVATMRAIWDGMYLPIGLERGVYFVHRGRGYYSLREDGDPAWRDANNGRLPDAVMSALAVAPLEALDVAPPDDTDRVRAALERAIASLQYQSGLEPLSFRFAPDSWREFVWSEYGPRIVERMARIYRPVPVRTGDTVEFSRTQSVELVLPPTDAGFAELLRRVQAGQYNYSALVEPTKAWWDRDFPKGVVDPRPLATVRDGEGNELRVRLEMAPVGGYAAAELPGGRSWAIAFVPGSRLLPASLQDPDVAKLGARWMANIDTDGTKILMDSEKADLLGWLSGQSDLPTLAELMQRFRESAGRG